MRIKKIFLVCSAVMLLVTIPGCGNAELQTTEQAVKDDKTEQNLEERILQEQNLENTENIAELYADIYEAAMRKCTQDFQKSSLDKFEPAKEIINQLGSKGYSAVDSENQIDMTKAEKVVTFCEKVEAGEEAETSIIVVAYPDGFTKYDLQTEEGAVNVIRAYYQYTGGIFLNQNVTEYPAYLWNYTEEGYLFFRENHMEGYDGVSGRTAIRVLPLDETCRELNRKYMLPIGYRANNLFLSDWSEDDFGAVDFYDMFDVLYPLVNGRTMPYVADRNYSAGSIYRIPKEEFESVVMAYFDIDSETLQSKTTYFPENNTYEYRPRGLYDCYLPEIPYPEVVDYEENGDRTLTLTVHIVYPRDGISKVYAHEVVVRPLAEGGFQYVANRIIPSEDNYEAAWHEERMTKEEWEEVYMLFLE